MNLESWKRFYPLKYISSNEYIDTRCYILTITCVHIYNIHICFLLEETGRRWNHINFYVLGGKKKKKLQSYKGATKI